MCFAFSISELIFTLIKNARLHPRALPSFPWPAIEHLGREAERPSLFLPPFRRLLSTVGVIASVSSTFEFGLSGGGHVGIVWGWLLPGFFVLPIAASLAELGSSMPTSGGLYYWSSALAPKGWAPFAAWITAYTNVTGQGELWHEFQLSRLTLFSFPSCSGLLHRLHLCTNDLCCSCCGHWVRG